LRRLLWFVGSKNVALTEREQSWLISILIICASDFSMLIQDKKNDEALENNTFYAENQVVYHHFLLIHICNIRSYHKMIHLGSNSLWWLD